MRVGQCTCSQSLSYDYIIMSQAREAHCPFCSKLIKLKPLWHIDEEGRWIKESSEENAFASTPTTEA